MTNSTIQIPLFGRIAYQDDKSRNYQIRTLINEALIQIARSYTWRTSVHLVQLEGSCTGHAFAHEKASRPKEHLDVTRDTAMNIYHRAQELDPPWFNTPPEEGSTDVAAAMAYIEQGGCKEVRWAGAGSGRALEDAALAVGYYGPVCAGTVWKSGMMNTDAQGFIHAVGSDVGGHEYLINAVKIIWRNKYAAHYWDNVSMGSYFTIFNSWPLEIWGDGTGRAKITLEEFGELQQNGGSVAIPIGRL